MNIDGLWIGVALAYAVGAYLIWWCQKCNRNGLLLALGVVIPVVASVILSFASYYPLTRTSSPGAGAWKLVWAVAIFPFAAGVSLLILVRTRLVMASVLLWVAFPALFWQYFLRQELTQPAYAEWAPAEIDSLSLPKIFDCALAKICRCPSNCHCGESSANSPGFAIKFCD